MRPDYTRLIEEYWPTIMRAWEEHADKHPVIECDVVRRKVAAMPAKDYTAYRHKLRFLRYFRGKLSTKLTF
jgi:hypothetical protein